MSDKRSQLSYIFNDLQLIQVPSLSSKWAWFIQELPSLCIPLYFLFVNFINLTFTSTLILVVFCLHYLNRALIYPFLIKSVQSTPLHIFLLSFIFCLINGYMQGAWHSHLMYISVIDTLLCEVKLTGVLVFFTGMTINIKSDSLLRNLRKDGNRGYKIPYGGLFNYISGANFFGECVEWIGYAIFARTLPAFAFAFFTLCNLAPRAYQHHTWYHEHFYNYPKDRKAFIPFVI
ncbi:unnamed protein product [Thelazia callipaeda]|uniref:3-oxo-5alpha-steroid 4-dehydrogenase (NADP(+)) n=1 Tax=Thelazia callipaeda TaxID=103827 RepID=A0A3P7KAN1_THECL|nr:unnamed protein product [Thelazia callipaeda]